MNHKNFDFTQIPDKTNDGIFLKCSKFQKKLMIQSIENVQADKRDGQTDPILQDSSGQVISSASDWWEHAKSCFKENAEIFSKNPTTQENITILRLK